MLYVTLSKRDIKNIFRAIKEYPSEQRYQRAQAIKLSSKGYSIPEISEILDVHYNSVYNWITKYLKEGIEGLLDKPRSGRPKLILDSQIPVLEKFVMEEPRRLKAILSKIKDAIGVEVSLLTVKRALKRNEFSYKRVRKSLKSKRNQEEFEKKKSQIMQFEKMEDENLLDLYYFDSCIFSLVPYIPYAWQKKGYEIELETSNSKNINVLGFFKKDNTFIPYTIEGGVDSEVIVKVFEDFISNLNPERKTKIIIDNAPTHTSKLFKSMKPIWKEKNVDIFNLPPYSPELNKIEILWRFIKYMWMSFDAYTSFEILKNSLDYILKNVGTEFTISFD